MTMIKLVYALGEMDSATLAEIMMTRAHQQLEPPRAGRQARQKVQGIKTVDATAQSIILVRKIGLHPRSPWKVCNLLHPFPVSIPGGKPGPVFVCEPPPSPGVLKDSGPGDVMM